MDSRTRQRGSLDTGGRLARFAVLALVLHVPLTPVAALLGLLQLIGGQREAPLLPPVTEIPLDILEDDPVPAKPPSPAEASPPETAVESEVHVPKQPAPVLVKPQPPKLRPDAKRDERDRAAREPDAGTAPDAEAPAEHKPGEGIASPVAGIADKRVVDPNANVQLLVHNDRVRRHPLGVRIGPLLRGVYQWRDFFGPTSIDPVRDIDRMLIVGPQLRDSRDVVAILQFNVAPEQVRAAVDLLVARDPQGAWLDAGVPVAQARADRGERAFVFPSPQVLVVTPPSAQASAERLPKKFRLPGPKGDEIALAKLATPWRAFLGLPFVIPKSIRSAEVRLSPGEAGGIVVDVLAQDETEPLAAADARTLTAALTAATSLDLGVLGAMLFGSSQKKFIERGSFEPDGTQIRGEIVLTRAQLETLLDLAAGFLGGGAPRPRPAPSAQPDALAEPLPSAR